MNKIQSLIKALKQLPKQMPRIFTEVVAEHSEEVEDLNAAQLTVGLDAEGDKLAGYRSQEYENFKRHIGSKSLPSVDLKVTGDYQRGITLKKRKIGEFQMINTDSKAKKLINKYPGHLGIAPDSREVMKEDFLMDGMKKGMLKFIGSKMK